MPPGHGRARACTCAAALGEVPPVVFQVGQLQEVSWEKRRKQRQISAAAGSDPRPRPLTPRLRPSENTHADKTQMCEQAPPTPEETRKKDSEDGIQDIPLLFVHKNRMLCPSSGHIYRSGENIRGLGSAHPSFPQCLIRLEAWPTTEPAERESSVDGEPGQVHQFQKNNLLPCFEGSSLPSMVGLGSGRGLEW